jgi:hypothetical protein
MDAVWVSVRIRCLVMGGRSSPFLAVEKIHGSSKAVFEGAQNSLSGAVHRLGDSGFFLVTEFSEYVTNETVTRRAAVVSPDTDFDTGK